MSRIPGEEVAEEGEGEEGEVAAAAADAVF